MKISTIVPLLFGGPTACFGGRHSLRKSSRSLLGDTGEEELPLELQESMELDEFGMTFEDLKEEAEMYAEQQELLDAGVFWDADGDEEDEGSRKRVLMQHNMFAPLKCNENVESPECLETAESLSTYVKEANSSPVIIPCGVCVKVDYDDGSTIDFPFGLEVLGRLHFPPGASVVINTTNVFVQGVWEMEPPVMGNQVKINFYGTEEKILYPAAKCNVFEPAECEHGKNVGKKAFAVAGGKLNINAIDPSCPSWTKLEGIVNADPPRPPESCPQDGHVLKAEGTFESESIVDVLTLWGANTFSIGDETNTTTGQLNHFLHHSGRTHDYTGLILPLDNSCLVSGRTYDFKFQYKLSGLEGTIVEPSIIPWSNVMYKIDGTDGWQYKSFTVCGEEGRTRTPNQWTDCNSKIEIDDTLSQAVTVWVAFHMGYSRTTDISFDNVSMDLAPPDPSAKGLKVGTEFASCVKIGEELLITSYENRGWDKQTVGVIESINESAGSVFLVDVIDGNLPTLATEPQFAVEVARLNRDVLIEAQSDDPATDGLHGGHLMILHTPDVPQNISGVEFVNFGQQGELGRYPIHFHMCGNVSGSIVSKNVVRKSNQRCVVVHGSHDVTVEDNVAFDTFGHCFILEDGGEIGNTFRNNLGAMTKKQIHSIGASDDSPSTFWITNPMNHYIGNVGAGSEVSGFWFDTRDKVSGPSFDLPENEVVRPRVLNLGTFHDNVAHSNQNGLQLYSPGWHPTEETKLLNISIYKNDLGVFWHFNRNIVMTNALIADNRVGVLTFQNLENNRIEDSIIIGLSDETRTRHGADCKNWHRNGIHREYYGIQFAYNEWDEGQPDLSNIDFSGFGGMNCNALSLKPYHADQLGKPSAGGIMHASGLTFDTEDNKMDIQCDTVPDGGIKNIYFEDFDGTIGPSDMMPGFFVHDEEPMKAFIAEESCSPVQREGSCALYCENICLRRARVETDPGDYLMVVTSGFKNHTFERNMYSNRFEAVLPAGEYIFSFQDLFSQPIYPSYTKLDFEKAPLCENHITETSIEIVRLPCPDEITIIDGKADSGSEGMIPAWGGGPIRIASEDGNNFFSQTDRQHHFGGIGVLLDTDCAISGEIYGLSLRFRSNSEQEIWPHGMLHYQNAASQWRGDWFFHCHRHARQDKGWIDGCYGTITLTDEMIESPVGLYVWLSWQGGVIADTDYDDISFAKHTSWPTPSCRLDGNPMISDGTANSESLDGIGGLWGGGKIQVQPEGGDNTNLVFSHKARTAHYNGVNIYLDACMNAGTDYTFTFQHRLHGEGPNGEGDTIIGFFGYTLPNGEWKHKYFLFCNEASSNSKWSSCEGSIRVDDEMATAVKLAVSFWYRSPWNLFPFDFDDVFFMPKGGS